MNQTFWRWIRIIHWILGAYILTALTFFAATGFMLNHGAWFERDPIETQWQANLPDDLPLPALSDDENAPTPALSPKLTAWLAERSPYPMHTYTLKAEPPQLILETSAPGSEASITIDSETRSVEYSGRKNGIISLLNNLHKGRHAPRIWHLFMDSFAILTVLVAVSGLALLVYYRKQRSSTWLWTTTGISIPLIIIFLSIHY